MSLFIVFTLTIVLAEAITNVISKSDLFLPLHKILFESNNKILKFCHTIIECPYCTSVWVGLFCALILYLYYIKALPLLLALFFMGVIVHRLSNIVHCLIDRIDSNHISLKQLNIEGQKNDIEYKN
ncbi:MAG: hypothetical protein DRO67_04120 [Candidatus Asgardarchaeum californiense]|nr:MAG: hypothetical protein DRO67_04120 [Candidatus Asgardarchaeum californiense]